ncbi:hypothetical protein [Methanobacterium subterraneum]|uniref:hypothetical protein n=1 Tax=Methanobacterium subterraneum TaxID=59277 RepID=UPI0012FD697F|nr:hypothetical protein [Methanobacterium subterraneum]
MNRNLWTVILSTLVVAIGLYEIFGLGQYTWTNYLSTFLFSLVVVISLDNIRNSK